MKNIKYSELKEYNWDDIYDLYHDAGWFAYTDNFESLKRGINNSLILIGAYDDERLVGLIRVIGDGETIIYIQDILILDSYQRLGIGTVLLDMVFDKYKAVRQKMLITDNTIKTVEFYKSNGMKDISDLNIVGFMKI